MLIRNSLSGILFSLLISTFVQAEPMAILRDNCIRCHSKEKRKGGLLLTNRHDAMTGGDSGMAINLDEPEKSLLLELLEEDADPHMPPKKQLSEKEINSLKVWIENGAEWDAALLESIPEKQEVTLQKLPPSRQASHVVKMAPDGETYAVGFGKEVEVHKLGETSQKLIRTLSGHNSSIHSLAWSQDGKLLAAGSFRHVIVWNVESGEPIKSIEEDLQGRISALAFLNDGQRLVIADSLPTELGQLHFYRTMQWAKIQSARAHTDSIFSLSVSSDGKLFASTSADKLARLWSAESLLPIGNLEGHTDYVLAAAFSPDSKRIATSSADHSTKVWNVSTFNEDLNFSPRNSRHDTTGVFWIYDPAKEEPTNKDNWLITVSDDNIPRNYTALNDHAGAQTNNGAKERAYPAVGANGHTSVAWSPIHKRILITDGAGQMYIIDSKGKAWIPQKAKEEQSQDEPKPEVSAPPKPTISFLNDILPILSRVGCDEGSCHAKQGGQNGFQLSIFAYDTKADHHELTYASRGRRIFHAAPDQSLILRKATEAISHEGGQRFTKNSPFYKTIRTWIEQGAPYSVPDEPRLTSLTITPSHGQYKKGDQQALKVIAHYSDDSQRDVTHMSHYQSNDSGVASINEDGLIQLGQHTGEGIIIVRYMDQVDVVRVTIPNESKLPDSSYVDLPIYNEIDRLNYERHKQLGLLISNKCSDSEFIRRATLDTTGKLPSVETVKNFLDDPSSDKRTKYIDQLLGDPEWADYWATVFNDLLRPNTQRVGVKPVYLLDHWIRRKLRQNTPWDEFVTELLTATGSSHEYGPVAFFRDKREPHTAGAFTSRIFLGVRLECAQCHHHPNEKWGQDDYYQLAAFYGSMKRKGQGISPPISGEPEYWWFQEGGEVKHPVTQEVMKPKPPDGPFAEIPQGEDPRKVLINWMLEKENPYFAKAIVNRIWKNFFGTGFVEPVDDFRASNPPTNGKLLDWLAEDFVAHDYDLKHLMGRILKSRTYQTSTLPNETNAADHRNYSRSLRRRLSAEVMADAVAKVTEVSDTFQGLPPMAKAMQVWNTKMPSTFLDTFGRPDASVECPCERDPAPTITQTLHLANNRKLVDRIAQSSSRASRLAKSDQPPEKIVEELYLSAFSRFPTESELKTASTIFTKESATRQTAAEDLLWALLNSAEFVLNH